MQVIPIKKNAKSAKSTRQKLSHFTQWRGQGPNGEILFKFYKLRGLPKFWNRNGQKTNLSRDFSNLIRYDNTTRIQRLWMKPVRRLWQVTHRGKHFLQTRVEKSTFWNCNTPNTFDFVLFIIIFILYIYFFFSKSTDDIRTLICICNVL